jgi:hypothetical protein
MSLADQGEKKVGRRFGKALRGKKSKSTAETASPMDEILESEDIKLTPENPVIEIPLSEMKPRRSLMSKYKEKKPKALVDVETSASQTKAATPKKSATKIEEVKSSKQKSATKRVLSPHRKNTEKLVSPEAKAKTPKGGKAAKVADSQPATTKVKTPNASEPPVDASSKKISSGASVSSKKSTKSSKSKKSRKSTSNSKEHKSEVKATEKAPRGMADFTNDDDKFGVKRCNTAESEGQEFSLRGWKDSEMESFEEAGGLLFCGVGNPTTRNDWLTNVEKTFTQMFDYCDHSPEEAYENTKVYDEGDDASLSSRFSRRNRSHGKTRGDRSVESYGNRSTRSKSNRSVKSRSDKSVKSRSDKSTKSRSKSRSDKSVGAKSTKSSKSIGKSSAKVLKEKPTTINSGSGSSEKPSKKSSSQSTSDKSTKRASDTTKPVEPKPTKSSTNTATKTKTTSNAKLEKTKATSKSTAAKKTVKRSAKKN